MKRVALYVRVSTQEQKLHGLSVDSQIDALKTYCEEQGYFIQGIYNDAGISARKTYKKRPALLAMLQACQTKQIDLIIFTKLDRFFRSVGDYYECVNQMNDVPWRAIWEDYETETSAGMLKVNIMLSVAQSEADRTSERIKAVNEYRREQGQYTSGKAPTGYKVVHSQIVKDKEMEEAVKAFFAEYLNSFVVSNAVKVMHEHGFNIGTDTGRKMLKNPAYYGESYGVQCEPYITKEQYDIIQKSLVSHSPKKRVNTYLFTGGIFKCAKCGRAMAGSFRKLQSGKETRYYKFYVCSGAKAYRCDCRKSISEKRVEKFLLENLEGEIDRENQKLYLMQKNIKNVLTKKKQLEAKLSRIGERYEDGDISRDEYVEKRDAIKVEIAKLDVSEPKKKTLLRNWHQLYEELDEKHRRAFWYNNIEGIVFDADSPDPIKFL